MTITITEQVDDLDLYGSLLRVFRRRELTVLALGNNIERGFIVPVFESDARIERVMLRTRPTLDAIYTLAWIAGHWFVVSVEK